MRRINQLNKTELVFYSKVIMGIQILIITDAEFAFLLSLNRKNGKDFLEFNVCFENAIVHVLFDRRKKTFSYLDILIPNGIFDEIVNYR